MTAPNWIGVERRWKRGGNKEETRPQEKGVGGTAHQRRARMGELRVPLLKLRNRGVEKKKKAMTGMGTPGCRVQTVTRYSDSTQKREP